MYTWHATPVHVACNSGTCLAYARFEPQCMRAYVRYRLIETIVRRLHARPYVLFSLVQEPVMLKIRIREPVLRPRTQNIPRHESDCTFRVSSHSQKAFDKTFPVIVSEIILYSFKKQWHQRRELVSKR